MVLSKIRQLKAQGGEREWPLKGIIAATFTPFDKEDAVDCEMIWRMCRRLVDDGIDGLFVCGSTGEGPSMTNEERKRVLEASLDAVEGRVPVACHVGHNCLKDAQELASHAESSGAAAIASITPGFFKPATEETFVDYLAVIAASAPNTPLYYYHFPDRISTVLDLGSIVGCALEKIPTFAGVKYSATDFSELSRIREAFGKRVQIMFGRDERFFESLQNGWPDFAGSTYNYALPLFLRLREAFDRGLDHECRRLQALVDRFVVVIDGLNPIAGQKIMMSLSDCDCGPVRLPLANPDDASARHAVGIMEEILDEIETGGSLDEIESVAIDNPERVGHF